MTPVPNAPPNLLLLSNSRNPAGEYLVHALPALAGFAGHRKKALFFPFAGVTVACRLAEYLVLNPRENVLGLPEGNWLEVRGDKLTLFGPDSNVLFMAGKEPAAGASGPFGLP